jgi:hypothetical protein
MRAISGSDIGGCPLAQGLHFFLTSATAGSVIVIYRNQAP